MLKKMDENEHFSFTKQNEIKLRYNNEENVTNFKMYKKVHHLKANKSYSSPSISFGT